MVKYFKLLCLILPVFSGLVHGQQDSSTLSVYDDFNDFGGVILLDSITVSASKSFFDVEDFIKMVREDKSFYKAFRNIRTLSYSSDNEIIMFSKRGLQKAGYNNKIRQNSDGKCRTMDILEETVTGNFYKNKKKKKLRYYTSKLFDQLFFTRGKICENETGDDPPPPKKNMAKHIHELKKLIFTPGEKANVPIIGNKTEIFSEKMAKYYDYSITSATIKNDVECYVFSAVIKDKYQKKKEDKTVIKSLHTYFEKSNFQVLGRTYHLKYYGALFDFDIHMEIELKKIGDLYVPEFLEYNGFWDIPAKKPEISKFNARFYDFQ